MPWLQAGAFYLVYFALGGFTASKVNSGRKQIDFHSKYAI
jgi:hypothetical protein